MHCEGRGDLQAMGWHGLVLVGRVGVVRRPGQTGACAGLVHGEHGCGMRRVVAC